MPLATVRGVDINYEILGERGPWVALRCAARVYRRQLVGVPAGALARAPPPRRCARPPAVARHRRRLCGPAPDRELLHSVHRRGAGGRHGGDLPHRAFWRADREQPGQPSAADGVGSATLYQHHGALAARLQRGRASSGDRVEPGGAALDDDAGLHHPRQRPSAPPSARPEDWEAKAGLLAAIFIDFLRRTERRAGGAAPTPFLRTRA